MGRTLAHILFGLGIGVLVALYDVQPHEAFGPLARALQDRASRLGEAFRRVVFAQLRIAAVNTALAKEKVQRAFANLGNEPVGGTAAEFGAFVSSQIAHWGTVVRESGIKMPR